MLARQGEQASMSDVAEAAGVARATVYRYFPNRTALLEELARRAIGIAGERLAAARLDAVPVHEAIPRAVRALVDIGDSFMVLARERVRPDPEEFERSLARPLRDVLERGQAEGSIRHDIPSEWLAESLVSLVVEHPARAAGAGARGHDLGGDTPLPRRRRRRFRRLIRESTGNGETCRRKPGGRDRTPAAQRPWLHASSSRTSGTSARGCAKEWVRRVTDAELLRVMTPEEIFSELTAVYDNYVDALETGSVEALTDYARDLSERIIARGVETHEVLGIVLLLRDVLARSLFERYQDEPDRLNDVLDAYEPAANRIAVTVGVSFVEERERVIREQQASIRELRPPCSRFGNAC